MNQLDHWGGEGAESEDEIHTEQGFRFNRSTIGLLLILILILCW